jgi:uncharacterized membrane protein
MEEIRAKDTGVRMLASVSYFLPFVTLVFGPLLFYFEFRKKSRFITFHALYNIYLITLAVLALLFLPLVALALGMSISTIAQISIACEAVLALLWAYGLAACAFGTTPIPFRGTITRQATPAS